MAGEILGEFIEDSREHLQTASGHLLALEKDPGDRERINGLLRSIHTIKGNAGFLDQKNLYHLLHQVENILQTVREKGCAHCPAGLIDNVLKVLDLVDLILDRLEEGLNDRVPGLDDLLAGLKTTEESLENASDGKPSTASPQPPPPVAPVKAERKVEPPRRPAPGSDSIESFFAGFSAGLGDDPTPETLEAWRQGFEGLREDLFHAGGPNARRAVDLIKDYLDEVQAAPRRESCRRLLENLMKNLQAWLEIEGRCAPRSMLVEAFPEDLDPDGGGLPAKVRGLVEKGTMALAVDIRKFQVLHSREIGMLISVLKAVPDQSRVGLILDPETQAGLIKALTVMGIDKNFRLFKTAAEAELHLGL
ncbi:MAG: Hpt domain-containing protein [Pseudomonadota bacterium]